MNLLDVGRRLVRIPNAALLIGFVLLCASTAEATPIRTRPLAAQRAQAAELNRANQFFARALQSRSTRVPRIPQLRLLQATSDGLLPQTPMVQYLQWRRSLNQVRFDQNHPGISAMLIRDAAVRPTISAADLPRTTSPVSVPGRVGIPSAQSTVIPEPSSILMGIAMLGAGALWARSARRRVQIQG